MNIYYYIYFLSIPIIYFYNCRHPNQGQEAGGGLKGPGGAPRSLGGAVSEGQAGAAGPAAPPDAGSHQHQHP